MDEKKQQFFGRVAMMEMLNINHFLLYTNNGNAIDRQQQYLCVRHVEWMERHIGVIVSLASIELILFDSFLHRKRGDVLP